MVSVGRVKRVFFLAFVLVLSVGIILLLITNNRMDKQPTLVTQLENTTPKSKHTISLPSVDTQLSYRTHIFYYAWYGTPQIDGQYYHWNHVYLPHWDSKIAKQFPSNTRHAPPDDIGANFYPAIGCYSSSDPLAVTQHMSDIRSSGVGVVAVSWYPPGTADEEGKPSDSLVPLLLEIADNFSIKITFHIEPYPKRNATSVRRDIQYIMNAYSKHPAFYMHHGHSSSHIGKPLFYIYDSYLIPPQDWAQVFTPEGSHTIRDTSIDCIAIGLVVNKKDTDAIKESGFDGFYTYFASRVFTFGSSPRNWKALKARASKANLLFIPSVGPGYIDTAVRPWNSVNTQARNGGQYYTENFLEAIDSGADFISITSYNEWHEGTQIEPAVAKVNYLDYKPGNTEFYLQKTNELISIYDKNIN